VSLVIVGALLVWWGSGRDAGTARAAARCTCSAASAARDRARALITVRSLGAGGVTAALVATQLGASAVADRFGWVGLETTALTPGRVLGIALLLAGTWLVTMP
jgi:hypothetical protein